LLEVVKGEREVPRAARDVLGDGVAVEVDRRAAGAFGGDELLVDRDE